MEYKVTAFRQDEFDGYLRFKEKFGDAVTESVTDQRRGWWCFDNPNGGLFAFAHTDKEIAATCYLAGKRLATAFGSNARAFEIGETWTAEQHRRRGLFSRLVEHCTEHAFANGALMVYGTPNQQSTPGYAKLGYRIIETPQSQLRMLINPMWFMLGRQKLRAEDELARLIGSSNKPSRYEIAGDDYLSATQQAEHFTSGESASRAWRLLNNPKAYRFFRLQQGQGNLLCAVRNGILGNLPTLVVAEAFLDGRRARAVDLPFGLRRVASSAYLRSSYAGVYWHGGAAEGTAGSRLQVALCKNHRQLPLCVKTNGAPASGAVAQMFDSFQLADCDIG